MARALYAAAPTAAEAAVFGMTLEEASHHLQAEVWPDNLRTVNVFIAMATQWRVCDAGPTGLDYNALPFVMRMQRVPDDEQSIVFDGVRLMEDAAMECLRKRKT